MSNYRKVSALDTVEALEVQVLSASENLDHTYIITTESIASWADETDFVTYARDGATGDIIEETRVVWSGKKSDDTNIVGTRVGGSGTDILDDENYFATVVPTHKWANDIVEGLQNCLPADGANGIKAYSGEDVVVVISAIEPAAVPGRTILWLRPLA